MNRSGFFFLLFAIAVAIGFTWLNSTWLSYKGFVFDRQERIVDYYLTDFSILNTYADGTLRYQVDGQQLVHQQSSGASKIIKPTLQARDLDNSIISITSHEAVQSKKNGPIVLVGEVEASKKSIKLAENFKLQTSDLTYNPTSRELSTDAKLTFSSMSGDLRGVGFSTKLDEQELRIRKNVRAKFIPQK